MRTNTFVEKSPFCFFCATLDPALFNTPIIVVVVVATKSEAIDVAWDVHCVLYQFCFLENSLPEVSN